jgi:hypothetical protein
MKNETSRRDFLGISVLGLVAAVTPKEAVPAPAAECLASRENFFLLFPFSMFPSK